MKLPPSLAGEDQALSFRRSEERSDRSVIFYSPFPDPILMGRRIWLEGLMAEKILSVNVW
jgi:hypothetical protein